MKTMKFSLKALMAMLLFCLPMVISSCGGDDDDDNGPRVYSYSWTLDNTTLSSGATTQERQEALAAENAVNTALGAAFTKQAGAVVNVNAQTFTITGGEQSSNDNKVKAAVYSAISDLGAVVAPLPKEAKVTVKRSGTQIISQKLKD
ncbi:MAG: hypothetical protein IKW98_05325 [Prevotella sp.]|nr:hypothetical protein [Prevotella sp.]